MELQKKKAHIQDLLSRARVDQLEKVGTSIGNAVKADLKVSHMPVVRILPRPVKNRDRDFHMEIPGDSPMKQGDKHVSSLSVS